MNAWILSVVGVICLGVLLEIVLPEGQTGKYVKGAFSLLVIFVIAAPLPKLLNSDFKLDLGGVWYDVDEKYISDTAVISKDALETEMENYLAVNGYTSEITVTLEQHSVKGVERVHIDAVISRAQDTEREVHAERIAKLIAVKFKIPSAKIFVELSVSDIPDGGGE